MDLLAGGDIHMCSSRVDGCPSEGAPPNQRVAGVQLGQWTGESEEGRSQANGKILCIHLYQSKHIEINFKTHPSLIIGSQTLLIVIIVPQISFFLKVIAMLL